MCTVPRKPPLKLVLRKCFTNPGRSVEPDNGSHSAAWPSFPAIEVNVPHSCAVTPGLGTARFSCRLFPRKLVPRKVDEIAKQQARKPYGINRNGFADISAPPDAVRARFRVCSHQDARPPPTVNTSRDIIPICHSERRDATLFPPRAKHVLRVPDASPGRTSRPEVEESLCVWSF